MTIEQEQRIDYLKEELKKEQTISSQRFNRIQELKKELKRYIDLYINNIK